MQRPRFQQRTSAKDNTVLGPTDGSVYDAREPPNPSETVLHRLQPQHAFTISETRPRAVTTGGAIELSTHQTAMQGIQDYRQSLHSLQPLQNMNASNDGLHLPNLFDQSTPEYYGDGGTSAADLEAMFEEIAMLDGNRQATDGSQFMQNLGVGHDLDLSAFFGTDYQQTDPLLAYLQPDAFASSGNNQNNTFPGS